MKKIALIVSLLWLPNVLFTWEPDANFFYWRHQLTLLTGAIGFAYMAVSMVLAMRLPKVEEYVNGLDKGYAIHKQMGIGALVALVSHWVIIESPKWLVSLGLLDPPQRRARLGQAADGINWMHWGKMVGEYTFYVFVAFVAISLIQAISYRKFRFTHKLAGAIFLAGAFHSVTVLDYQLSASALNIIVWICAVIGSLCAVLSLSGQIGRRRKVTGRVTMVKQVTDESSNYRVLHIGITLDEPLDYKAGQFAYLDFHDGEAPHPFSVLKYDPFTQQADFAIKDLGDYTHQLFNQLNEGRQVTLEGGYGRFQIPSDAQQVWIGAGIGVVPFVAWLQHLTQLPHSSGRHIELFYCRDNDKQQYFVKLLELFVSKLPNVNLHVFTASHNEFLCAERVAERLNLAEASVSFCGPVGFGSSLKNHLINMGLSQQNFHSERFAMR
ncbi:ferric reductase-like transmembrane domain-containing protein [Vibrio fluvialis]|nr:ferric reductase-like transmembrane domain-containing protein [Vibrio fluvialis]